MKRSIIILLILLSSLASAQVKRKTTYNDQVWFGDLSRADLNDKWSICLDLGLRRTDWLERWSQILVRGGITRKLNKNIGMTVGVAYFNHYSAGLIRPEYRGWQQLLFTENYGRVKVSHRLRTEQRFNQTIVAGELVDDYNYTSRYRYQLSFQFALNRPQIQDKTLYLALSDEVMMNSGKEVTYNYFDQNRLAGGIGYRPNERLNVLVSYMNVFIQRNSAATYEKNNVLVINVYNEFSLRRKKV